MDSTKLEIIKDALTAAHGLVYNVTALIDTCESKLGQDYGLHQVTALLRLTIKDLAEQMLFMNIDDLSIYGDTVHEQAEGLRYELEHKSSQEK